uniref:Uncharacterized protein n=1 Tax=Timema cristinae TaxID=61476 RepID=A0A7R9CHK6_TIMCR|nr:unnamed protein product [Timema cristinae]
MHLLVIADEFNNLAQPGIISALRSNVQPVLTEGLNNLVQSEITSTLWSSVQSVFTDGLNNLVQPEITSTLWSSAQLVLADGLNNLAQPEITSTLWSSAQLVLADRLNNLAQPKITSTLWSSAQSVLADGINNLAESEITRRGTGITGSTVLLKPDGPPDARPPTDTVLTGVVGQLPTSSYFRRVLVRMGMISRVRARLQSLHTLTKLDPRDQDDKTAKTELNRTTLQEVTWEWLDDASERKVVADYVVLPDGHVSGVTSQHTINTPHYDPGPPCFNHEHAKQRTLSRSLE